MRDYVRSLNQRKCALRVSGSERQVTFRAEPVKRAYGLAWLDFLFLAIGSIDRCCTFSAANTHDRGGGSITRDKRESRTGAFYLRHEDSYLESATHFLRPPLFTARLFNSGSSLGAGQKKSEIYGIRNS